MRRWWRLWWDGDVLSTFYRSNEGYIAIKGWQNKVFSFVEIRLKSEHAKTWRLLVCSLCRRYLKEKPSVNTFIRQEIVPLFQMPYLAKSYDSSVVSYLTWKLGVTYFLNHPVYWIMSRNKNNLIVEPKARRLCDIYSWFLQPNWDHWFLKQSTTLDIHLLYISCLQYRHLAYRSPALHCTYCPVLLPTAHANGYSLGSFISSLSVPGRPCLRPSSVSWVLSSWPLCADSPPPPPPDGTRHALPVEPPSSAAAGGGQGVVNKAGGRGRGLTGVPRCHRTRPTYASPVAMESLDNRIPERALEWQRVCWSPPDRPPRTQVQDPHLYRPRWAAYNLTSQLLHWGIITQVRWLSDTSNEHPA